MKPESITGDKHEFIDMEINQCIYLDPKKKPQYQPKFNSPKESPNDSF